MSPKLIVAHLLTLIFAGGCLVLLVLAWPLTLVVLGTAVLTCVFAWAFAETADHWRQRPKS